MCCILLHRHRPQCSMKYTPPARSSACLLSGFAIRHTFPLGALQGKPVVLHRHWLTARYKDCYSHITELLTDLDRDELCVLPIYRLGRQIHVGRVFGSLRRSRGLKDSVSLKNMKGQCNNAHETTKNKAYRRSNGTLLPSSRERSLLSEFSIYTSSLW